MSDDTNPDADTNRGQLAERVRAALLECALAAHEDARLQGLCMEGAWEAAVSAMCALDVAALARGGNRSVVGARVGAPAHEK